jgi:DNA polymerase-3 subunit alpha
MWEAVAGFGEAKQSRSKSSGSLFNNEVEDLRLPGLERNKLEDLFDEIELFGFTLQDPFQLLKDPVLPLRSGDMERHTGKSFSITGYLVTTKPTQTAGNKIMNFGTFLDANGQMFDTVHFPESSVKYPFRGRGFYNLSGKITEDFGVTTLEVSGMEKLSLANLGRK